MELVNFYPKTFAEIPKQDNPAFNGDKCLMITKAYGNDKTVVLNIVPDPIESVNHVAEFWDHKLAVDFCNEFLLNTGRYEEEVESITIDSINNGYGKLKHQK